MPTLPAYIKNIIIILEATVSFAVSPCVKPTVPIAETHSYSTSVKMSLFGSIAQMTRVDSKTIIRHAAKIASACDKRE